MSENIEEQNENVEKPFQVNDIQPGPGLKIGGISTGGDVQEPDGDTPIINAE